MPASQADEWIHTEGGARLGERSGWAGSVRTEPVGLETRVYLRTHKGNKSMLCDPDMLRDVGWEGGGGFLQP